MAKSNEEPESGEDGAPNGDQQQQQQQQQRRQREQDQAMLELDALLAEAPAEPHARAPQADERSHPNVVQPTKRPRTKSSRKKRRDNAPASDNLRQLLQYVRPMHAEHEVDVQKAQRLLEATAGNINMAAQLYWDDYFASAAVQIAVSKQQQQPGMFFHPSDFAGDAARSEKPRGDPKRDEQPDAALPNDAKQKSDPDAARSMLRKAVANAPNQHNEDHMDVDAPLSNNADASESKVPQAAAAAARANNDDDDDDDDNDDDDNNANDEDDDGGAEQPNANANANANANPEAAAAAPEADAANHDQQRALSVLVSVSDDEAAPTSRRRNARSRRRSRDSSDARAASRSRSARTRTHAQSGLRSSSRDIPRARRQADDERNRDGDRIARADHHDLVRRLMKNAATMIAKREQTEPKTNRRSFGEMSARPDRNDATRIARADDPVTVDDDSSVGDYYLEDTGWADDEGGPGLRVPCDVLWGEVKPRDESNQDVNDVNENDNDNMDADNDNDNADNDNANDGDNNNDSSNNADDNNDDNNEDDKQNTVCSNLPAAWYHAGFTPSTCSTGLMARAPTIAELEHIISMRDQREGWNGRSPIPDPFHCRSVTAILSIVTAMMYAGVSIQGNVVDSTKAQAKFSELSRDDKRRDFERRLTDALSALIHVAVKTSLRRKTAAFEKYERRSRRTAKGGVDREEQQRMQVLKSRLNLFRTCAWLEDPGATTVTSNGNHANTHNINKILTSCSHIDDIYIFVKSSIRKFMARGGVALFLEVIIGIHGNKAVKRMLARAQADPAQNQVTADTDVDMPAADEPVNQAQQDDTSKPSANVVRNDSKNTPVSVTGEDIPPEAADVAITRPLISCTCCERHLKKIDEKPIPLNIRNNLANLLDMTPPGTSCISVELISLILTGEIHTSWEGWSTENLGFGILTNGDELDYRLIRPVYPVWVLVGDTSYTNVWVDGEVRKDCWDSIGHVDKAGEILDMLHWNPWYGKERKRTSLRLTMPRDDWKVPKMTENPFQSLGRPQKAQRIVSLSSTEASRLSSSVRERSKREYEAGKQLQAPIRKAEIDACHVNLDDMKFYPKELHMWRFSFNGTDDNQMADAKPKVHADAGVPYFRLTERQKQIAESKVGARLKTLLWRRFPNATINHFDPVDPHPII